MPISFLKTSCLAIKKKEKNQRQNSASNVFFGSLSIFAILLGSFPRSGMRQSKILLEGSAKNEKSHSPEKSS